MTTSVCTATLLWACGVTTANAAGFYLQEQSAKATGRAYSGEAADTGADSLWWNPAAIAGIGQDELYGSLSGIIVSSHVADHGSTIDYFGRTLAPGGNHDVDDPVQDGLAGSTAVAVRLDDDWSAGLAVTSPYSFVTQYPADSWMREAALTSRLTTIDIQPTLAWRPWRWLGLGIGPNVDYVVTSLSNALPNLSPLLPAGQQTLHGNGWNAGFNVGVQLHPVDSLTIGIAYRSAIEHRLSGKLDVSGLVGPLAALDERADAGARFSTPWAATAALRWQATDRLVLEAQSALQGWSAFDAISITSPIVSQVPESYHDTLNIAVGADVRVTQGWTMRAGIQYDPTPTPGASRDPRVPDASRWLFSTGTSIQATARLSIDAAFSYVDFQRTSIMRDASAYGGSPAALPVALQGQATASGIVLALGTRIRF